MQSTINLKNTINLTEFDEYYMKIALMHAHNALKNQEVPVGCIFVYNNDIIAQDGNKVNETCNATRHAEINCIDHVLNYCNEKNIDAKTVFQNIYVYVTVEPCIMCAAALYNLNIKSVTFGCQNDRFGGQTVFDVSSVLKPITHVKGGYYADEAMSLLKKFYKGTNPNAPNSKVKTKGKLDKKESH